MLDLVLFEINAQLRTTITAFHHDLWCALGAAYNEYKDAKESFCCMRVLVVTLLSIVLIQRNLCSLQKNVRCNRTRC